MYLPFVLAGFLIWIFSLSFQLIPLSTITASAGQVSVSATGISPVSALGFVMGAAVIFMGMRIGGRR